MLRTSLKTLFYSMLALFVLAASLLTFLVTTTPGLYVTFKLAQWVLPYHIHLKKATGRLLDGFEIQSLQLENKTTHITLENLSVQWNLHDLKQKALHIRSLNVGYVLYETTSSPTPPSNAKSQTPFAVPTLPVALYIHLARIEHLRIKHGALQETIKSLELNAELNAALWRITSLKAHYAKQQLSATAQLTPTPHWPLEAKIHITPIKAKTEAIRGTVTIGGSRALYHWKGHFENIGTLHFSGTLKDGKDVSSNIQWQDLHWHYHPKTLFKSSQGNITLHGQLPNVTATVHTDIQSPLALNTQLKLVNTPQVLTLKGTIQQEKQQIRVSLQKKTASLFDLQGNLRFTAAEEGLNTTVRLEGRMKNNTHQEMTLTLLPGRFQVPNVEPLTFKGGHITAHIDPKGLHATGLLSINPTQRVHLSLSLPGYAIDHPMNPQQPLRGELLVTLDSLAFIQQMTQNVADTKGQLQAKIGISGTLGDPMVKGHLTLVDASISLPRSGIHLEPVRLSIKANDHAWTLESSLYSEKRPLFIKGQGVFYPNLEGSLTVRGEQFSVLNTKEYKVKLSPDLMFRFKPEHYDLNGKIIVSEAQIQPLSFSGSVSMSEDIVFTQDDEDAPQNATFPLSASIDLIMGDAVNINIKGLKGQLKGQVNLTEQPNNPIRARGELNVENGRYTAYGQDLTIDQGQLLYTGGLIDNPDIKVRAVRRFNNIGNAYSSSTDLFNFDANNLPNYETPGQTTVGVEVSGRLNAPKLNLFSVPATYSQADILSLLVLGKPASQANQAGGKLLLAAITSMNLDSGAEGTQLMDSLKKNLGVDIDVQTNTQLDEKTHQTTDSTSFVLSKSLSRRISVSYNLGLLNSNANMITLRYLLNRYFTLQINAGMTASGGDLLYTYHQQQQQQQDKK